jgi:hypothetical protein
VRADLSQAAQDVGAAASALSPEASGAVSCAVCGDWPEERVGGVVELPLLSAVDREVDVGAVVPASSSSVLGAVLSSVPPAALSSAASDSGASEIVDGAGVVDGVVGVVGREDEASVSWPSVVVEEVSSAPTSADTGCWPTISIPVTIPIARPKTASA